MMHLYPSRHPEEATCALLEAMRRSLQSGRRAFLVVPSQFTVEAEQTLFDTLNTSILMEAQVKSFPALVRDLLQTGSGLNTPVLSEQGRRMLIRHLLEEQEIPWSVFTSGTRGTGLIDHLMEELREWKEYGITPESLLHVAERFEAGGRSRRKLEEMSRLYQSYESFLRTDLQDSDDRFRHAFMQPTLSETFRNVDFYFDRFHSMSLLERQALRALSQAGLPLHVALTLDPKMAEMIATRPEEMSFSALQEALEASVSDAPVFALTARFAYQLSGIAPLRLHRRFSSRPSETPLILIEAQNAVFSLDRHEALLSDAQKNQMQFAQFRNSEEEVDALAIAVRRLVMQNKARWKDILICLSDEEEYGTLLRQAFIRERIPFFDDHQRAAAYHPLMRLVDGMLHLIARGLSPVVMIQIAKTGFVGFSDDEAAAYQNFITQRRIRYGMFEQESHFTADEAALPQDPESAARERDVYEQAWRLNQRLLHFLQPLRSMADQPHTVREWMGTLVQMLHQPVVLEAMQTYEEYLESRQEAARLDVHHQVWNALMGLCDEMVLLFSEEPMDARRFSMLLQEGMKGISLGVIPPFADQVFVGDLKRSRVRPRKFVFLVGMNDQHLPSTQRQSSLLTQEEKDVLAAEGEAFPSMDTFAVEEEKLNFYTLMDQTRVAFFASTAMQTKQNEPLRPSFWMTQIRESIGLPLKTLRQLPLRSALYSRKMLLQRISASLHHDEDSISAETATQLLKGMKQQQAFVSDAERLEHAFQKEHQSASISDETIRQLFPSRGISASQLEHFARCPYQYFVQYGLKPQREASFDVEGVDLGSLLHSALDAWTNFLSDALKGDRPISDEASMDALQKAWEEQQQRSIDRYRRQFPRNAFLIRQAAQALGETHRLLLDQINANQVDQIEHEVPFGPYEGRHTLELIQTPRSIALQGRIDRVDHIHAQDEDAVVVTDYKTGSRSFDPGDVFSGNYLQLPLYLSAAAGKQATPVGAFYLHVQSPEIRDLHEPAEEGDGHPDGFFVASERMAAFDASVAERTPGSRKKSAMEKDGALSEEEMDDFLEEAQQVARSLLQRREEGEIQAKPLYIPKKPKKSPCRYCEYRSLCHFDPMGQFGKQRFVASLSWKEWKDQRMKQRVSTPDSKGKEH